MGTPTGDGAGPCPPTPTTPAGRPPEPGDGTTGPAPASVTRSGPGPTAPAPPGVPPRSGGDEPSFPEPVLRITAWSDPVLDKLGHDPRSGYVERFWLPILGPSCLLLARRLAAELERRPEGLDLECARWARELGLGMRGGRHGPFWRSIERACRFGVARRNGERLAVRRRLSPLTARQVGRLPEALRADHELWARARLERTRRPNVVRWTPGPEVVDVASIGRAGDPDQLDDAA